MEIIGREENISKFTQTYITSLLSGKSFKDENFPVASFFIGSRMKKLVRNFYFFARTADDISDHIHLIPNEKLKILNFFDKSIKDQVKTEIEVINKLLERFNEFKFTKKYSRQLLVAFKLDAKKKRYKNWKELVFYCKYSANPVGRFFIDLTYLTKKKKLCKRSDVLKSSDGLCTALQIINHLQDCKKDYELLDRVYLPISLFTKYSINLSELTNDYSSSEFEKLKQEVILNVEKILDKSYEGIRKINIWSLRKETLIIYRIAKKLCLLLKKEDPLKKNVKLSRIDLIFCFIKGIICY